MKNTTSFSEQELNILKNMIGKQFNMFKCDPFMYAPMVYGIVGLYVDNIPFKITALFESEKRFFCIDDVAVFRIEQVDDDKIRTFMDGGALIESPVFSRIVAIDIVNDHQSVEHEGDTRSIDYTVGIIFHLEDAREISLEIKTWFSEMITIEKGYHLIEKFTGIDDFLEEWEGCDGYTAKCTREVVTLS